MAVNWDACLAAVVAFLAVALLWAWLKGRTAFPPASPRAPYRPRPLLTPAEAAFFPVLLEAMPDGLEAFVKVRVLDLVAVADEDWHVYGKPVSGKHVDFVLVRAGFEVALVVELDDKSHKWVERQKRDQLIDSVLTSAGIPVLRVPCRRRYEVWALRKQISLAVAKGQSAVS